VNVERYSRNSHSLVSPHFNGHFPDEPLLADFIGAKDGGSGGDNWSFKTSKASVKISPPTSQQPTFYRPNQQYQSTEGV